jgi:hypothetical protein
VKILGVTFHGEDGEEKTTFKTGDDLIAKIRYHAYRRVVNSVIGIGIRHGPSGFVLTTMANPASSIALDCIEGEGVIYCRTNNIPLIDGAYLLTVAIQSSDHKVIYDHHFTRYTFTVNGVAHQTAGLLSFAWSPNFNTTTSVVRENTCSKIMQSSSR